MTSVGRGAAVVSVVVPFLDRARFLPACIESLLHQHDPGGRVELIFVDNGSRDGAAEVVADYPDVTLLREERPGAYAARNAGVRRATAPVVAFTDADCVPDPDWLLGIREGMTAPESAILIGECRYQREASWALRALGAYENAKAEYVLARGASAHHFAYANNMAVRSSVFEEIGPFREWRRAADTELVHRLAARHPELRTSFCPAMRVTHREFLDARARARRLALYTETNARIETFRELGGWRRLAVLGWAAWRLVVPSERAARTRERPSGTAGGA